MRRWRGQRWSRGPCSCWQPGDIPFAATAAVRCCLYDCRAQSLSYALNWSEYIIFKNSCSIPVRVPLA